MFYKHGIPCCRNTEWESESEGEVTGERPRPEGKMKTDPREPVGPSPQPPNLSYDIIIINGSTFNSTMLISV